MKRNFTTGAAVGAIAAILAGAGGYLAHAGVDNGAVNQAAAVAAPGAPGSFADIVQRVAPAVVSIDVEGKAQPAPAMFESGPGGDDQDQGQGQGQDGPFGDLGRMFPQLRQGPAPKMQATASGFFISSDGYIVTNNHVVEGADKITVRTKDDRKLTAHLVGRDPATDLAVIKVDGSGFPFVSFEDRAKPRVGDWVVAVGNPFGLGGTATAGIVSAIGRRDPAESNYVDYMQIDAPINRGNSGGPTFDAYGRVVGVNTSIYSPSGGSVGIGFDIPADVAASIAHRLIADGKVVRGYIGAQIQDVTPEIADSLGLPGGKGALVAELTPGGPSQQAGLKPGDLVMKIDGRPVDSASDLTRQVALVRAGEMIHLEVRRDGHVETVNIRSGVRPDQPQLARYDGGSSAAPGGHARILGMSVEPNGDTGLTIDSVGADSDAGEKGLHRGDVILQASGHPTASAADLSAAVAEARRDGRKAVLLMVARNGQNSFVPVAIDSAKG